ncbi:MAG: rhodanese-like domain-containing protein [Opitutae bacterium]|nr:rhodanese-like domain-containing protein [Opitutae bacterium]
MKFRLLLLALLLSFGSGCAAEVAQVSPAEAAQRVAAGSAVLVDVREPAEWAETGVAAPAVLLSKGEFDADLTGGWKPFLQKHRDRPIILYCHSGRRSGLVAAVLAKQGYTVANAGGFKDWKEAGLPVRNMMQPAGDTKSR